MLNAALHHFGITEEDDFYPTQVAGVYVSSGVRQVRGCEPRRLVKAPGDVLHLGMPALAGSLPSILGPACDALALIEAAAERYIRGVETASEDRAIRDCADAYTFMMGFLQTLPLPLMTLSSHRTDEPQCTCGTGRTDRRIAGALRGR